MTGLGQDAGRDRADVSGVAGEQDAHVVRDLHMSYASYRHDREKG
jgi:hypothetical protein